MNISFAGHTYPLKHDFTIGRSHAANLQIHHKDCSPAHAIVERRGSRWLFRDLSSQTGSRLNGLEVLGAYLSHGDALEIAGHQLQVHATNSSSQPPSLKSKNLHWNRQLQRLDSIARTDLPVLILGESGSGKEILAREIHQRSQRRHGPLVSINCSALSESLIESELFGHIRGSYTGATTDRKGAFEAARGGTLFLDEIGDLPLGLQPKLLRALENEEIRPIGLDRCIKTDVRVITATHRQLDERIRHGQFRADLFYRLNVLLLTPPPLRERKEDFESFAYQFAKTYKVRFSHEAFTKMKDHSWPGNLRELKNFVAKISVIFPQEHIQAHHVVQVLRDSMICSSNATHSSLKELEKQMISKKLAENFGNQRRTALELGIPKSTLHDRIKTYQIDVHQWQRARPA